MFITQFSDLRITETYLRVHFEVGENIVNGLREGALHHEDCARRALETRLNLVRVLKSRYGRFATKEGI